MQTVCFTTTAKIRKPSPKIVDMEDYRRENDAQDEPVITHTSSTCTTLVALDPNTVVLAPAPKRTLHRRLRGLNLALDLCLSLCALALTVLAILHLLAI